MNTTAVVNFHSKKLYYFNTHQKVTTRITPARLHYLQLKGPDINFTPMWQQEQKAVGITRLNGKFRF